MEKIRLFPYISDVYAQTANGGQKLIAKGMVRHTQLDIDLIDDITEYVTNKGKIDLKKSVIIHRELGTLVLAVPVQEMWELRRKVNGFEVKGFKLDENERKRNVKSTKKPSAKRTRTSTRNKTSTTSKTKR